MKTDEGLTVGASESTPRTVCQLPVLSVYPKSVPNAAANVATPLGSTTCARFPVQLQGRLPKQVLIASRVFNFRAAR